MRPATHVLRHMPSVCTMIARMSLRNWQARHPAKTMQCNSRRQSPALKLL